MRLYEPESELINKYRDEIYDETGVSALIEPMTDWQPHTPKAYYDATQLDPIHIFVAADAIEGVEEEEYLLGHELTHGLLAARGYVRPSFTCTTPGDEVQQLTATLGTMVEDSVVDSILGQKGFNYHEALIREPVERDLKRIPRGEAHWARFEAKPDSWKRLCAFRYTVVWAVREFPGLSQETRGLIAKYLQMIERYLPEETIIAKRVIALMQSADLRIADEYERVVKEIADEWGLTPCVTYEPLTREKQMSSRDA